MIKRWLAWAEAHPAGLVFFLALAFRLAWIATLKPHYYWMDEQAFAKIAQGLSEGRGYISTSYRANPGLPVYLSLVFRIVGENLFIARLGQCLWGALTCFLILRIAGLLINQRAGLISGLVLAAYPPHIYLSGVFYAEGLMIFWGAVGMYLAALVLVRQPRLIWAGLAGIALGAAVLTRSTLAFWIPCAAAAFLYQSRYSWFRRWQLCGCLFLGGALTILPWTMRNHAVYGQLIPVSTGFGTTLWQANNPFSTGLHTDWFLMAGNGTWSNSVAQLPAEEQEALHGQYDGVISQIQECKARTHDEFLVSDRLLLPLAVHYMLHHPGLTLHRSLIRLRLMFSAFAPTESSNEHTTGFYKWIAAFSYYPVLILGVLGMVQGFARRREIAILYLAIWVVMFITMLLTGTQTRYRLPIDPYLIIFAAIPLADILTRFYGPVPQAQTRDAVCSR